MLQQTVVNFFCRSSLIETDEESIAKHDTAIHHAHMMHRPYTIYKDVWYGSNRTMPITFGWSFPNGKILPRDAKELSH